MRIGATIILLNGYCYQSYNWNIMRPLGELQRVLDSLEEYQCDEVSIIRPIRKNDSIKKFKKDIDILKKIKSMTPLSFGGGLRDCNHIELLGELPIERIIFSTSFLNKDFKLIEYSRKLFGSQAIQCLLPFKIEKNNLYIFLCDKNSFTSLKEIDFDFVNRYANEIILLDTKNEGMNNLFDLSVFNKINISNKKIIISGGIGKETIKSVKKIGIAAVLIDNKVLHKEYSIKWYRNA